MRIIAFLVVATTLSPSISLALDCENIRESNNYWRIEARARGIINQTPASGIKECISDPATTMTEGREVYLACPNADWLTLAEVGFPSNFCAPYRDPSKIAQTSPSTTPSKQADSRQSSKSPNAPAGQDNRRQQAIPPDAPIVNGVRLPSSTEDAPRDQRRATNPHDEKVSKIKGGNRNSCISFTKTDPVGYDVSNRCGDPVYVEIRRKDGGLYTIPLKPFETLRQFWGEGSFKYRGCKGTDSTACG